MDKQTGLCTKLTDGLHAMLNRAQSCHKIFVSVPVIVCFVAYLATISLPRDWITGGHNVVRPRHWLGSPKLPVENA